MQAWCKLDVGSGYNPDRTEYGFPQKKKQNMVVLYMKRHRFVRRSAPLVQRNCKWCMGTMVPFSKKTFSKRQKNWIFCTHRRAYYVCTNFLNILISHVTYKEKDKYYVFNILFLVGILFFYSLQIIYFQNKISWIRSEYIQVSMDIFLIF